VNVSVCACVCVSVCEREARVLCVMLSGWPGMHQVVSCYDAPSIDPISPLFGFPLLLSLSLSLSLLIASLERLEGGGGSLCRRMGSVDGYSHYEWLARI
jgi:hypothetical protein